MKALWIRHASSTGQAPEARLSPEGLAQADVLADTLTRLRAGPLYTSPFARAKDTLAPYAIRSSQAVTALEGLRERLLSPTPLPDWLAHIARSFQDRSYAPPGGESFEDLSERARPELRRMAELGGARPCVATHGNLTAALFHQADPRFGFEDWRGLRNPDLFEVTIWDGRIAEFQRIDLEVQT